MSFVQSLIEVVVRVLFIVAAALFAASYEQDNSWQYGLPVIKGEDGQWLDDSRVRSAISATAGAAIGGFWLLFSPLAAFIIVSLIVGAFIFAIAKRRVDYLDAALTTGTFCSVATLINACGGDGGGLIIWPPEPSPTISAVVTSVTCIIAAITRSIIQFHDVKSANKIWPIVVNGKEPEGKPNNSFIVWSWIFALLAVVPLAILAFSRIISHLS